MHALRPSAPNSNEYAQTFPSASPSFPTAHTWANWCVLFIAVFGLVHTNQSHVLGTLTAEPEVLHPLATCFRRQNELINLALETKTVFQILANKRSYCVIESSAIM
jgi:hypothetical protein